MKRRQFLRTLSVLPAAALSESVLTAQELAGNGNFSQRLEAAFETLKFHPASDERNGFFVVAADIHYGQDAENFNRKAFQTLIQELNSLPDALRPEFLTVLGDCGCSMSSSFGAAPNLAAAKKEYEWLKKDLASLNPQIGVKLLAGNHDTPPGDAESEIFCQTFGTAPYGTFEACGLQFVFLDGAHDGFLRENQSVWLRSVMEQQNPEKPLVLMIHQPLGFANERGLSMLLPEVMKAQKADVFLLAGHEHSNAQRAFRLPQGRLMEWTHISAGGGWKKSGTSYWIYCIANGQLAGRIQRRSDGLLEPEAIPEDFGKLNAILQPFEAASGKLLVRALLGQDDSIQIQESVGGNCQTYFFYLRSLTLEIQIPDVMAAAGLPRRLAILGNLQSRLNRKPRANENTERKVFLSAGGEEWVPVKFTPLQEGSLHWVELPEALRTARRLRVRVESLGFLANDTLAGVAIFD